MLYYSRPLPPLSPYLCMSVCLSLSLSLSLFLSIYFSIQRLFSRSLHLSPFALYKSLSLSLPICLCLYVSFSPCVPSLYLSPPSLLCDSLLPYTYCFLLDLDRVRRTNGVFTASTHPELMASQCQIGIEGDWEKKGKKEVHPFGKMAG